MPITTGSAPTPFAVAREGGAAPQDALRLGVLLADMTLFEG
jgi:hypothetical protein